MHKKVLLTGGRTFVTLDLVRLFAAKGHRVYVAETSSLHVSKFSNSVTKSFLVPTPRFETEKYIDALVDIVEKYEIDLVIPVYEEIMYISHFLDRFPKKICKVFCESIEVLEPLHNKWLFAQKQEAHNIETPKTYLIEDAGQLDQLPIAYPFIIKACYSRASQSITRVYKKDDLPKNLVIDPSNPLILQELIEGKKYCTYSVCKKGKVLAHVTYPVEFSIDDSSCLSFRAINHEKILQWVQNFVSLENFSGQIAFDFIENEDQLLAIECNPRGTSGVHLFAEEVRLVDAFFDNTSSLVMPSIEVNRQLACGMVCYGWRSSENFGSFFKKLFRTKDIIFSKSDIKPFLFQPLLYAHYIFSSIRRKVNLIQGFTHDVDWNGNELDSFKK